MRINPYELLVQKPDSTFFLRAGADLPEFGLSAGDYIIVDRQAEAPDGKLVIAHVDSDLRMKLVRAAGVFLEASRERMDISGREHFFIWGVVRCVLREMRGFACCIPFPACCPPPER